MSAQPGKAASIATASRTLGHASGDLATTTGRSPSHGDSIHATESTGPTNRRFILA